MTKASYSSLPITTKIVEAETNQILVDLSIQFYFLPGVIGSAVNGSGPDEAGRLVVEGRPADGTAQASRVPRPAGHLNQEAVGNQLAASSAHSGRDSRLTAGSGADQTADSAANTVATDAADAADAQAARRVDRTVGGRRSFRLKKRAKFKSLLFRLIYLIMTRKTGTQSTGTLSPTLG